MVLTFICRHIDTCSSHKVTDTATHKIKQQSFYKRINIGPREMSRCQWVITLLEEHADLVPEPIWLFTNYFNSSSKFLCPLLVLVDIPYKLCTDIHADQIWMNIKKLSQFIKKTYKIMQVTNRYMKTHLSTIPIGEKSKNNQVELSSYSCLLGWLFLKGIQDNNKTQPHYNSFQWCGIN